MNFEWVVVDGHCAAVLNEKGERIAFIEKSPRVRVSGPGTYTDGNRTYEAAEDHFGQWWVYGPKGSGGGDPAVDETYGFDPNSRAWCERWLRAGMLGVGVFRE